MNTKKLAQADILISKNCREMQFKNSISRAYLISYENLRKEKRSKLFQKWKKLQLWICVFIWRTSIWVFRINQFYRISRQKEITSFPWKKLFFLHFIGKENCKNHSFLIEKKRRQNLLARAFSIFSGLEKIFHSFSS